MFQTESIALRTHWVPGVMDHYSRRIIGFALQPIAVDAPALCRMFSQAVSGATPPRRLSFDRDPLFAFLRWKANLCILQIQPVRSASHGPVSHPFVERLIGTIRREYLNHLFCWNGEDLQRKLDQFRDYFNEVRVHAAIGGRTPDQHAELTESRVASLDHYRWRSHCQGLFRMPEAA